MPKTLVRVLSLATLLAAIFTAALFAGHASAGATFAVTKTADTADGTCDSDCSLREATIAANISGGTVGVPAGTYTLTIPGTGENASLTGDLDITAAVTIVGAGPGSTIIDGNNLDTVLAVRSTGNLVLSGVTVQHGKDFVTGGIFANGPLTLTNVHVSENQGTGTDELGAVGGVTIKTTGTITDSLFSMNTATGYSTGGLYGQMGSSITVRNTIFEGNSNTGKFPTGAMTLQGQGLLDNVIVRNNSASGKEAAAGLFTGGTSIVTIMNSQFLNNDATGDDAVGGIFNRGNMTIWDTTVDGNDTTTNGVGGILSRKPASGSANLTLRRVTVSNNSAGESGVGGLWVKGPAFLGEVTIDHNSAAGGGVAGVAFSDADPVHLSRVAITNNAAGASSIGGASIGGASHVTIDDSWIDHNTAAQDAVAGINVENGSVLDANRVGITNNSTSGDSSTGGMSVNQATATLTNVTVSGNSAVASSTSGGIGVTDGTLTLNFTTIDNNTAGNQNGVGGLTNYGTLHISNSIVGHNPGHESCYQTAGASTGHNIDQGTDCGFHETADKQGANPQLGALGFSDGGFSPTEPIGPNSPAADAAGSCALTEDQRIYPRPQGNGCDIGAFEYGVAYLTKDLKWGDLKCANGPGADDALAMIAHEAGMTVADLSGTACPALGANVYVAGWFLRIGWGDFDCDGHVTILDPLAVLRGVTGIGYQSVNPCPMVGDTVQVGG